MSEEQVTTDKDLTLHDGDGLFLMVKTSGKKLWRFRYQRPITKQRTIIGLDAFPAPSLAEAQVAACLFPQDTHLIHNAMDKMKTRMGISCRARLSSCVVI